MATGLLPRDEVAAPVTREKPRKPQSIVRTSPPLSCPSAATSVPRGAWKLALPAFFTPIGGGIEPTNPVIGFRGGKWREKGKGLSKGTTHTQNYVEELQMPGGRITDNRTQDGTVRG